MSSESAFSDAATSELGAAGYISATVQGFHKLSNPTIPLIIVLAITDEDVVFVTWYD